MSYQDEWGKKKTKNTWWDNKEVRTDLIIVTKQKHLLMKVRYWYDYVDVKSGILGFSSIEIYYIFSFNGFINNGFLIIPSSKTCELKETPREREEADTRKKRTVGERRGRRSRGRQGRETNTFSWVYMEISI